LVSHALFVLMDIAIHPDYAGLPPNVMTGLTRMTNNAAALLLTVSALGVVLSLLGLVLGSWMRNPGLKERSLGALAVSAGAGALLYVSVGAANYTTTLFH
jgi:hypothetical protein